MVVAAVAAAAAAAVAEAAAARPRGWTSCLAKHGSSRNYSVLPCPVIPSWFSFSLCVHVCIFLVLVLVLVLVFMRGDDVCACVGFCFYFVFWVR